jgi:hypothetical protein
MKSMQNKDKIMDALCKEYRKGDILSNSQIIACVQKYFPEVPAGSINPFDYCCNHRNIDPISGKYHIYEKQGRGKYKLL